MVYGATWTNTGVVGEFKPLLTYIYRLLYRGTLGRSGVPFTEYVLLYPAMAEVGLLFVSTFTNFDELKRSLVTYFLTFVYLLLSSENVSVASNPDSLR